MKKVPIELLIDHRKHNIKKWNSWRALHPYKKVELNDLDLSCLNFVHADLSYINFMNTLFHDTDFHSANLQGSILKNCDMRRSVLAHSNLYGATLRGANLYKADLRYANMSFCTLEDADLRKTLMHGTIGAERDDIVSAAWIADGSLCSAMKTKRDIRIWCGYAQYNTVKDFRTAIAGNFYENEYLAWLHWVETRLN